MFILRSAFWLTVAFVLMAPKHVDLGARAQDITTQAAAAGQQLIVEQILSAECGSIECIGGKAIVAAALSPTPSVGTTMQDSPTPAPIPRPRPDWMG